MKLPVPTRPCAPAAGFSWFLAPWLLASLASAQVTEVHEFLASDGAAGDRLGATVDLSGGRVIAGARYHDAAGSNAGAAYVFLAESGAQVLKLTGSDTGPGDEFGGAVASHGSRALVGAPYQDATVNNGGAAYLFDLVTGQELLRLEAHPAPDAGDHFGFSVAMDGQYLVVGSPLDDDLAYQAGAVYVHDAATGAFVRKLVVADGQGLDSLGLQVAVGGGLVAASCQRRGFVAVFDVATGQEIHRFLASPSLPEFGADLDIAGGLLVVGSPRDNVQATSVGAAHLYDLATGEELMRFEPDVVYGMRFGSSCALTDELVLVGARSAANVRGWVYAFDLGSGAQVARYESTDQVGQDQLGSSVAVDEGSSQFVAGAPLDDEQGSNSGSLYSFPVPSTNEAGVAVCSGDGSGSSCPCGVPGSPGAGCANSAGDGARLLGFGSASVHADSFRLFISGAPGNKPGLLLRGANLLSGGQGNPVGDGLLCVGGQSLRSQVQITTADGAALFSSWDGLSGLGAGSALIGAPTRYQFWYRDPAGTCTGAGFNFSNAWQVLWLP